MIAFWHAGVIGYCLQILQFIFGSKYQMVGSRRRSSAQNLNLNPDFSSSLIISAAIRRSWSPWAFRVSIALWTIAVWLLCSELKLRARRRMFLDCGSSNSPRLYGSDIVFSCWVHSKKGVRQLPNPYLLNQILGVRAGPHCVKVACPTPIHVCIIPFSAYCKLIQCRMQVVKLYHSQ